MFLDDLLGGILKPIVASVFPDPADKLKAQELQIRLQEAVISNQAALEEAAAANVKTEAASKFWLAANWRPLVMMDFAILITARWFGFNPPGMSEAELLEVYGLMKAGICGYGAVRSGEKLLPVVMDGIAKIKKADQDS